ETLDKWAAEGHIPRTLAGAWRAGSAQDRALAARLGFDFSWGNTFGPRLALSPAFRSRVVAELPGGARHVLNDEGVIVLAKPGIVSIPSEIDHLLKGRQEWQRIFRPRLRYTGRRLATARVETGAR